MKIVWHIRYLDRNDQEFKDRKLWLDTETLDAATKAAVELVIESRKSGIDRRAVQFRHLFRDLDVELDPYDLPTSLLIYDYCEDENGNELSLTEAGRIVTGNPDVVHVPSGLEEHDIEFMFSEPTPLPVGIIKLSEDNERLLAYFVRDYRDLSQTAFLKDSPGNLSGKGGPKITSPVLTTAVTPDELESFIQTFRRLYMTKHDPAHFLKTVEIFSDALAGHSLGKWVKGCGESYKKRLDRPPSLCPFAKDGKVTFSRKLLIDVFLYTQFAHQPNEKREREFNECLAEVDGYRSVLTWLFLIEIWDISQTMISAGKVIDGWFARYCDHHKVSPPILATVRNEHPGLGVREKEAHREARLRLQKLSEFARQIWIQRGSPAGGPEQFAAAAEEQLETVLGTSFDS